MDKKAKEEKSKLYQEAMGDKDVGEFLNDQLYEHGMTNKGDILSEENTENYSNKNKEKNKEKNK